MNRFLPLLATSALIVVCGYVHGIWTDRWAIAQELENAVVRLESFVPMLDDWESRPLELDPQKTAAGVVGCLLRRYENKRTGHATVVMVTCGRPGPMAVHTPEICYAGAGYAMAKASKRAFKIAENGSPAEFWTAKFTKGSSFEATRLRLYWCWRGKDGWEAPNNPRMHFAGQPYLYKLYVIQELTSPDEAIDDDQCRAFIRLLLPELDRGVANTRPTP